MKGSHRIIVQNKRIRYDFEIRRNITVIRGDSATGKTALVDMIREHFENGSASGVELTCDKECTVLEGRTWTGQLSMMRDCIVFIDEGNDFVASNDFAAIQDTDNYYVIVTREGIPFLPYGVEEIYGIRNSGKYGTLKRTYNEFYHLYKITDFIQTVKPKKVITEDSNSGFQFFHVSLLLLPDLLIQLHFILIPHNKEHDRSQNRDNDKHNHTCRSRPVVHITSAECLLVDKQTGCQRRIVRLTILEQSRDIEHIQTADQTGNKRKQ